MIATRFAEAAAYEALGRSGCAGFRLQGGGVMPASASWVGISHFLPGGGADWDGSNAEKVYLVLEGAIPIETPDERVTLGPRDTLYIAPGERRRVINETNDPASMAVIVAPVA